MAWTTLTYAFGSTLPSSKMTSLQDNFTALAQGLSGAPKFKTAALNQVSGSEAVVTAAMRSAAVTLVKLPLYAAGDYIEAAAYGTYASPAVADTPYHVKTFTMNRGGVVRILGWAWGELGNHGDILLYKNGAYTGDNAGGNAPFANGHSSFPVDLSIAAGDTISFYITADSNLDDIAWVAVIDIDISTALVPRPAYGYGRVSHAGMALG